MISAIETDLKELGAQMQGSVDAKVKQVEK